MKNIRNNLKYIFPVLIVIMIAGLVLSRIYQPESPPPEPEIRITAAEARDHIGTPAEVCGKVVSADYLQQVGGKPTFINLGRPYPDQTFTAVIWGDDRTKWTKPPELQYEEQNVCVTGKIESHEGTPQIIVSSPGQIAIQ